MTSEKRTGKPDSSLLDLLESALQGSATRRRLSPGEVLFSAGQPATALFGVLSGRLRLHRTTIDGGSLLVATLRAGDTLAEASLFSPTYHCRATADVPSTVTVIPHRGLRAAIAAEPSLAEALAGALARQVQEMRSRLELRNVRSAVDRLLQALHLGLGDREEDQPLKDLAEEIGLTPACLYRTIAALERRGVVGRRGGRLWLCAGGRPVG